MATPPFVLELDMPGGRLERLRMAASGDGVQLLRDLAPYLSLCFVAYAVRGAVVACLSAKSAGPPRLA